MKQKNFLILPLLLACNSGLMAQLWKPILAPDRAINWSNSGVGAIPTRKTVCASLTPTATLAQINLALANCPREQTVLLAPGTYSIPGTINIPSYVTLRGAGADQTILNATGTIGGYVVSMGTEAVPYRPVRITGGSTAGSTVVLVENPARIAVGKYLVITETNNLSFVTSAGSEGNCNWCDRWTKDGSLARGQIVEVTAISDHAITIAPALYGDYTHSPLAVPFNMVRTHSGVEDLQVYANNTGYAASFGMSECAYCWIKGVESNYTDGDMVEVLWGYRDEVRDSYFSNAFLHKPGDHDSDIHVAYKTSASLFENNIVERARVSIELGWGAAGNVFAYNYTMGEFITDSPNAVVGGVRFHGAHPQFNLLEGNVLTTIDEDPVWGSSSHTTAFRNWVVGTNRVCIPYMGRGTVSCAGPDGHYGFQAARAIQISYLGFLNNFVGNLLGSAQMQSLTGYRHPLAQVSHAEYPTPRSYDAAAYGWTFGYGSFVDNGTGTGCDGGQPPCHLEAASSSNLLHGNFNNVDGSIAWASGLSHAFPSSFYLTAKPGWWASLPFPSIGPDVNGGSGPRGHSFGNPAQYCYTRVMGGTDGGAGSPLSFNAHKCYGN